MAFLAGWPTRRIGCHRRLFDDCVELRSPDWIMLLVRLVEAPPMMVAPAAWIASAAAMTVILRSVTGEELTNRQALKPFRPSGEPCMLANA